MMTNDEIRAFIEEQRYAATPYVGTLISLIETLLARQDDLAKHAHPYVLASDCDARAPRATGGGGMTFFAITSRNRMSFGCISSTREELDDKVQRHYWIWRSMKSRLAPEETKSKEAWAKEFVRVYVDVKELEDDQ